MKELTLLYVHGENIGYARAGTYIAQELEKKGIKVWDDDGYVDERTVAQNLLKKSGSHIAPPSPTNLLCYVSVPSHFKGYWNGQHKAILTMWEAMTMPPAFRANLHEFDTVIVPSLHNVDLFSQYHDNVHLLLLGVDPALWHYVPPPPPDVEFRFMHSGRGSRKGGDLAYEAFRRVFPRGKPINKGPIPKLIMKAHRPENKYFAEGVENLNGRLTPQEEVELYQDIHCYIQPSRGEGFGLQPLQAIATGRPTILSDSHGHESFASLGIPIHCGTSKADYFIYGDAGEWWEPNLEEICEAMYDVYMNYESHAYSAMVSADVVAKHWTWKKSAETFIDILGEEMEKPYSGDNTRLESIRKLFMITVNQEYEGEIGGRQVYFEPGKVYYDMADVKRIFFDAGILSNECLEGPDLGLAPVQLQQVEHYKAHAAFCRTCGQQLNSGIKRSDLIYEELQANAQATH